MEKSSSHKREVILEELRAKTKEQVVWFINNFPCWFPGGLRTKDHDIGRLWKDEEMVFTDSNTGEVKKITNEKMADEIRNSLIETGHPTVKSLEFAMTVSTPDSVRVFEDVWVDLRLKGYSQEFLEQLTI